MPSLDGLGKRWPHDAQHNDISIRTLHITALDTHYVEGHYAECCYAEYRHAECHNDDYFYAECHSA